MSSRIKRFRGREIITKSTSEIIGKTVNIVLLDGSVFLGIIKELSKDNLTFINTRNSKYQLEIDSINEIIIDYKS